MSVAENKIGQIYAVGAAPVLRRLERAVTSWAGANGLVSMILLGTPLAGQSLALAPLM